jgi:hypothetical protein
VRAIRLPVDPTPQDIDSVATPDLNPRDTDARSSERGHRVREPTSWADVPAARRSIAQQGKSYE